MAVFATRTLYPVTVNPAGAVQLGVKDVNRRSVTATVRPVGVPGIVEDTGTVIEATPGLPTIGLVVAVRSTAGPSGTVALASVAQLVLVLMATGVPMLVLTPPTVAENCTVAVGLAVMSMLVHAVRVPCQPAVALLSMMALAVVLPVAARRLVASGVCQVTVGGGVAPTVTAQLPNVPKLEEGLVAMADTVSEPASSWTPFTATCEKVTVLPVNVVVPVAPWTLTTTGIELPNVRLTEADVLAVPEVLK